MNNVRASDPLTSVMAAERSELFSGKQRDRIMAALDTGPKTADGISFLTCLTVEQVCRRLPELKSRGLAEVVNKDGQDWIIDGYRVWRKA